MNIRAASAALAAILALGGCHRSYKSDGSHNAWTQPGVVRLGEPDEPDSLNPMFANTYAADQVGGLLYSYIFRYDANGNLIPDLATAIPAVANHGISADGKTITVHLRPNVTWADGAPLTAHDWIFTYHAVKNPANNTKSLFGWDEIVSAAAPNDTTLVIHLKAPDAAFLGMLAMGSSAYPPLPAHILASLPNINHANFNQAPLSSGPYILKVWNHGSSLVFVPNPRYFRGAPHLAQVIWNVIPNTDTLFDELQAHEIDVYPNVDENAISRLGSISGITVRHTLLANWRHIGFNLHKPLLADVRVRRAITEGVEWKHINNTIYHGYNQLAVSDVFPNSWAAPKLPPYRFDPADAAALLDAAGWLKGSDGIRRRSGVPLHLTISTGTNKMENQQAEVVIQSMLKPLGIDVEIKNYPVSLLFAQNGPLYSGTYDMEWSIETNGPDPDNSGYVNSAFIPPSGANTSWLNDPLVDQLSEAAKRTYDLKARAALYQREELRLRELYPQVVLYWEVGYTATNSDLQNYRPAAFIADTWNSWEWRI